MWSKDLEESLSPAPGLTNHLCFSLLLSASIQPDLPTPLTLLNTCRKKIFPSTIPGKRPHGLVRQAGA